MAELSIIIVNWNAGNLLFKAVQTIYESTYSENLFELIIVDNASIDGSMGALPQRSNLRIIQNDTNVGFGAACNQGYEASTGKYVLLFNPDAEAFPETLEDCVNFMNENTNIDILGVRHVDEYGSVMPSCSRFPNFRDFIVLSTGLSQIAPSIFRAPILMSNYNYECDSYVDQVMGAFMFIRRTTIEKLDMFMDERFFVYYDDIEFSKRVALQGGKSYYNASIKIIHKGNGTTSRIKGLRLYYSLHSRLKYIQKYFSSLSTFLLIFVTLFIEPIARIVQLLINHEKGEIREVFQGYKLLYKKLF